MKVVHIGGYPPPYGGVTTHVKRLDRYCRDNGITSVIIDTNGSSNKSTPTGVCVIPLVGSKFMRLVILMQCLAKENADIVHFHISGLSNLLWGTIPLWVYIRKPKKLVSLHSGSFIQSCESIPALMQRYLQFVLKGFDHILAANSDQYCYLTKKLGIAQNEVSIVPAFLPPAVDKPVDDAILVSGPLFEFIGRFDCTALITGYAKPYYGFHTAIEAFDNLKGYSVGLVINFYTTEEKSYKDQLYQQVKERSNIFISENLSDDEMVILLKAARIFIRATSVDGDSVALREAAFLGKDIVATDCVPRPRGCLLFPFDDAHALSERISEIISGTNSGIIKEPIANNGAKILGIYAEIQPELFPKFIDKKADY